MVKRIESKPVTLPTDDGFELGLTHLAPSSSRDKKKSVVVCSDGTRPMGFYQSFAEYLASEGFRVVLFDYRGTFASRISKKSPEGDAQARDAASRQMTGRFSDDPNATVSLEDWGQKDLETVFAWLARKAPEDRVYLVGHRTGGQILSLAAGMKRVGGIVFVGCSNGYWRNWGKIRRYTELFRLLLLRPGVQTLIRKLGLKSVLTPLPSTVALQLAGYGLQPDYLYSAHPGAKDRLHGLKAPVLVYSFDKDMRAPLPAVRGFLNILPRVCRQWHHIAAKDISVKSLARVELFKPEFRETLWKDISEWLSGSQ